MGKRANPIVKLAVSAVAGGLALAVGVFPAGIASAATAKGCTAHGTSVNRNGVDMDNASAPGAGGTSSHPLRIDADGSVVYDGQTNAVIQDGSWKVVIYGLDSISGKVRNRSGTLTEHGISQVHKYLHVGIGPFNTVITGKYKVTFKATGASGASCSVDGYIYIVDSPVNTPFFALAALMLLIAVFLLIIWGQPDALLDIMAGDYQAAADDIGQIVGDGGAP
jgi:hypothetical protein